MRNMILFLLCIIFIFGTIFATDTEELYNKSSTQFLKSQALQAKFTDAQLDQDLLEAAIFHQVNVERAKIKLAALKHHRKLVTVARRNSQMMAKLEQLQEEKIVEVNERLGIIFKENGIMWKGKIDEYVSLAGTKSAAKYETVPTKIKKAPYDSYNLFVEKLFKFLMSSKPHRERILNPQFKFTGVGVFRGNFEGKDSVYITQEFGEEILN
ncbi:CAP domain-containing protein [candidate division KSB1 bacterium]|nr:CAP domain-containing protein [candidate division KSB1 bacterium]